MLGRMKPGGIKREGIRRGELRRRLVANAACRISSSGARFDSCRRRLQQGDLAPIWRLARRLGISIRVVAPALQRLTEFERTEGVGEMPSELEFLTLLVDADVYRAFPHAPPLSPTSHGVLLISEGFFCGPDWLADACDLLLRAELHKQLVHFEHPSFAEQNLTLQTCYEECAGLAREIAVLVMAPADVRRRAELLIGTELPDQAETERDRRAVAAQQNRRQLLESVGLAALQRRLGHLTASGLSVSLLRLVETFAADAQLFDRGACEPTREGYRRLLGHCTRHDADFQRDVTGPDGVSWEVLAVPAGAAERVAELVRRSWMALAEPDDDGDDADLDSTLELADRPRERATKVANTSILVSPEAWLPELLRDHAEVVFDLRSGLASDERHRQLRGLTIDAAKCCSQPGTDVYVALPDNWERAQSDLSQLVAEVPMLTGFVVAPHSTENLRALNEALTELERLLLRERDALRLQLVVETPELLTDLSRIGAELPRLSAVELGDVLPSRMGWCFVARAGEQRESARERRWSEAEHYLERARRQIASSATEHRWRLVHPPLPPSCAGDDEARLARVGRNYQAVRQRFGPVPVIPGPGGDPDLHGADPQLEPGDRLSSFEMAASGRGVADPDRQWRLREDLAVLDAAASAGELEQGQLERYWRAKWTLARDRWSPETIAIPAMTLPALMNARAAEAPQRGFHYLVDVAQSWGRGALTIAHFVSYRQLLGDHAHRIADALTRCGISKGDRVALCAPNTLGAVAAFQAVALCGAILVPLDPSRAHLADRYFNDVGVSTAIIDCGVGTTDQDLHLSRIVTWLRDEAPDLLQTLLEPLRSVKHQLGDDRAPTLAMVLSHLPITLRDEFRQLWCRPLTDLAKFADALASVSTLRNLLIMHPGEFVPGLAPPRDVVDLSQTFRDLRPEVTVTWLCDLLQTAQPKVPELAIEPEAPVLWAFTGGTTTGHSKAAIHTHRSLIALGLQRGGSVVDRSRDDDCVATTLAMTHTYGLATSVLTPVLMGVDAVLLPNLRTAFLESVAGALLSQPITVLFSSRTALTALAPLLGRGGRSRLRQLISSGDTLTPRVVELWRQRAGITPRSGYGSTETPSSLVNPICSARSGSEGIPAPNVEARVVDVETGMPLPPGTPGLLQIRGPHLTAGYVARPNVDDRAPIPGGWWQKDDIFSMDRDGFFTFRGRADDMFTVKELNVFPATVEQAILSINGISACAVIGVWDEAIGSNRVKAYAVPEPGVVLSEKIIIHRSRNLLEAHEVPALVEVVDELARSNFGKVARQVLRAQTPQPQSRSAQTVAPPEKIDASHTALVFAGNATMLPELVDELEQDAASKEWISRAARALADHGISRAALLSGIRSATDRESYAAGDPALAWACNVVAESAMAAWFIKRYGSPAAVVGKRAGEISAYITAGVIELEAGVRLAYLSGQAYARANVAYPFCLAVVDQLRVEAALSVLERAEAQLVSIESRFCCLVSLPRAHTEGLEREIALLGGRCHQLSEQLVTHEPRSGADKAIWRAYHEAVASLELAAPRCQVLSVIDPPHVLDQPDALRQNLRSSRLHPLQWCDTIGATPLLGVSRLVQIGAGTTFEEMERLRRDRTIPETIALNVVLMLSDIDSLDAPLGRAWGTFPIRVDAAMAGELAALLGRRLVAVDESLVQGRDLSDTACPTLGMIGLVISHLHRRFPSMVVGRIEMPTVRRSLRVNETLRAVFEVREAERGLLKIAFWALNGWGDILCDGVVKLVARRWPVFELNAGDHPLPIAAPAAVDPLGEIVAGAVQCTSVTLTEAHCAAVSQRFAAGTATQDAMLGLTLLSHGAAHTLPGFVHNGLHLTDVRQALRPLRAQLRQLRVSDADVAAAWGRSTDLEQWVGQLPLADRQRRTVSRTIAASVRYVVQTLLTVCDAAELVATWTQLDKIITPGDFVVRTSMATVAGSAPRRQVSAVCVVVDQSGRVTFLGGLSSEEPREQSAAPKGAGQRRPLRLGARVPADDVAQTEGLLGDASVDLVVFDLTTSSAQSSPERVRREAVSVLRRIRRDAPRHKRALVAALQQLASSYGRQRVLDALKDYDVTDEQTLFHYLGLSGSEQRRVGALISKAERRLFRAYLENEGLRLALCESLGQLDAGERQIALRIHHVRSSHFADDCHVTLSRVGPVIDHVMLPGVRRPDDVVLLDQILTGLERALDWRAGAIAIVPIVDHPLALVWLGEILRASGRVKAVAFETVSYIGETGGWDPLCATELQRIAKETVVSEAARLSLTALDEVTPVLDGDLVERDAAASAALGFQGTICRHERQLVAASLATFLPLSLRQRPRVHQAVRPFELNRLAAAVERGSLLIAESAVTPRRAIPCSVALLSRAPDWDHTAAPCAMFTDLRSQPPGDWPMARSAAVFSAAVLSPFAPPEHLQRAAEIYGALVLWDHNSVAWAPSRISEIGKQCPNVPLIIALQTAQQVQQAYAFACAAPAVAALLYCAETASVGDLARVHTAAYAADVQSLCWADDGLNLVVAAQIGVCGAVTRDRSAISAIASQFEPTAAQLQLAESLLAAYERARESGEGMPFQLETTVDGTPRTLLIDETQARVQRQLLARVARSRAPLK